MMDPRLSSFISMFNSQGKSVSDHDFEKKMI